MGTWFDYLHFPNLVSWYYVCIKPPLCQPYKPVVLGSDGGQHVFYFCAKCLAFSALGVHGDIQG